MPAQRPRHQAEDIEAGAAGEPGSAEMITNPLEIGALVIELRLVEAEVDLVDIGVEENRTTGTGHDRLRRGHQTRYFDDGIVLDFGRAGETPSRGDLVSAQMLVVRGGDV
jgi:hypothetical protein